MKFSYRDSYDINAPVAPGRAKTVICSAPRRPCVIQLTLPPGATMAPMTSDAAASSENAHDSYLWLEDVTREDALDWVRARNEPTLAEFRDAQFERMRTEALEVLDTDTRIPYVVRRGEYLY